jgi:hypothetical protein
MLTDMLKTRRGRRAAELAALTLLFCPAVLAAQETNTVVGPPQIKDFQLPGQRTTPPAQTQPAPRTPEPAPPAATNTPRPEPTRTPTPATRTPRPTATAPSRPAPARPTATAPAITPAPVETPSATTAPSVAPPATTAPPTTAAPTPAPAPAPAPTPTAGWNWAWAGVPVLLALLAFAFLRTRRRDAEEEAEPAIAERIAAAPTPRPAPTPAPKPAAPTPAPKRAPAPAPADAPRAWLELDIRPVRAAATDAETRIHYDLILRNAGAIPAGNIRIDARMFNADEEQAMADFLAAPLHERSGSPDVQIAPGDTLELQSAIAMPKKDVRAIDVQGLAIFVPMVAVNVAYDYAKARAGRTSKSWLVGREAAPEAAAQGAKMGAFRLDQGPRIYRQVGRREGKLVMV